MPADEFDIIRTLFAPLATSAAARGLMDDAAVLGTRGKLVATTDAIVEGVHFLSDDPIDSVAKKALRVNLSDLAAKGAKPIGALLALIWPNHRPAAHIADFARGLGEDLTLYSVPLLGGDTTSTPGPLTVCITALGEPCGDRVPARADARGGDDVWLTGEIGGAYVGLLILQDRWRLSDEALRTQAISSYRTPVPPVQDATLIARFAAASIDVSDGLIADAEKIAEASGVCMRINAAAVPLAGAARRYAAEAGREGLLRVLSAGDDYQTLFTAPAALRAEIVAITKQCGPFTLIGNVAAGAGVALIGADGVARPAEAGGHRHKLGR